MEPKFWHLVLVGVSLALLQVHLVNTIECGTVNFVRPAILGGTETVKGEWPFIVAIQRRSNYICGGTIVSIRHILTAAHCIQKKNSETELSPYELVVRLGVYNVTHTNEKGMIERNVSAIFIHPDWEPFEKRFDADIAILVLSENVTFSDDIQPVCMPANGIIENMEGSVVGYGVRRRTVHAEVARRIIVRTVSRSHCFREDDAVAAYTSNRTFCGGNGDGSPDIGDSGSGYFFTPGFSWAQYGLVAVVRTNATGHVFPHAYNVYTNLTMFKDWIIETVNRTGGVVGEARMNIIMDCDYTKLSDSFESLYICRLYNIDIQGNNFETGSFKGSHAHDKGQQDVDGIHFVNGTMSHLPSGFGLFFENIRLLTVGRYIPDSTLLGTKVVRRSDLRNLRNLGRLSFFRNDIETLHEDALWDLPQLQSIQFIENKLKALFNETFSKNKKLIRVNFHSNQLNFLPANLFRNNLMLMAVNFEKNFLKAIDEKIFQTNRRLHTVILSSNQLETLPQHLFRKNVFLHRVDFAINALTTLDEDLFETNVKLRATRFLSNKISSLPPTLFRNNERLHLVDFQKNGIKSIDESLFVKTRNLQGVSFAYNRLEYLQRNVFKGAPLLNVLDLFGNRLTNIDINFAEMEQITAIDLSHNECVDAKYSKENVTGLTSGNIFGDLVEFQNHVLANCGTGSSDNSTFRHE